MLRRGLDALYAAGAALAALALFLIFALMMAQMALRPFNIGIPASDDISAYLCVAVTFFALGATLRRGELIRVGMVLDRLPPGARRVAEAIALIMAALLMTYALYWTVDDVIFSWEIDDVAQGSLAIPLWIPKLSVPMGGAILLIAILDELVTVLRGHMPNYVIAAEERAARGDFSAEV